MKASQLVAELQASIGAHGDLEVITEGCDCWGDSTGVELDTDRNKMVITRTDGEIERGRRAKREAEEKAARAIPVLPITPGRYRTANGRWVNILHAYDGLAYGYFFPATPAVFDSASGKMKLMDGTRDARGFGPGWTIKIREDD
jgi:hypothetical protein